MAAVLDALAPCVKKLLTDMAQEEVSVLLGVSAEITKVEDNMEGMKAFLADAERRRITDTSVQRWTTKLKNAMYDATDILDLCQLEAEKRRDSRGGSSEQHRAAGCFQPLVFCLRNPRFAHKIGSRIKELNQRLEGIHKEADKYKFNIGLGSNLEPRMLTDTKGYSQKMTSEFDDSSIVGKKIEMDTKELGQLLTTNDAHHGIKVLSIIGAGGMGKTTLAQKIFNETAIQQHFKLKIWLSITQLFNEVELLQTAIEHAGGVHGGVQDKTLLVRNLTNTLSAGKFLLVLDDVWGNEAWSQVLSVPIKNASQKQQGNWVLITTRLEDLAHRMGASFYQHHVAPLDDDDAWSLLNKELPPTPSQVHGTDHLIDVGMKIISKCGGLPLAIKVMGGLLSTKSRSKGDWEAVLYHRAWSITGLPQELDNAIYLSYEHLSPQLKQCFLYCSLFPKGTTIWNDVVVPMWISEGFICPPDGSSSYDDQLEEIADGYYRELITRNLIEPDKDSVIQYSCTMHDVVRSFAEFMSKEESLVVQDEQDASGSRISQVRRLSIGSTKSALEWDILPRPNSLRTLIINQKINVQPSDSLRSFSTLRVLLIIDTDCDALVESLRELRQLRYLHLEDTNISRLPGDIDRIKFLQHIRIYGCPNLDHLPSCITQLLHLRTLNLLGSNKNILILKGFGQLTNLRTLYGFRVHLDMDGVEGWCSLAEIGPLSQLRNLRLHGLENVPSSSSVGMAKISCKEHLDYLGLHWNSSRFMELGDEINKQQQQQRVVEEVIEKLNPSTSTRHLYIKGYFGSRLPNWMNVPATCAFNSLRHLRMDKLHCCTELPNGLCQLPSLETMDIIDVPAIKSVGPEFQSPSYLAVGGGGIAARSVVGFPNLTFLRLDGLCEWKEWDWEEASESETTQAMAIPALNELRIISCKLSCLPPGLASSKRDALRKLVLHKLSNLTYIENTPSVVELEVFDCPKLKRISNLSKLQRIKILWCPNVEVLGVPSLDSMEIEEPTMETLPEYMTTVTPRYLKLTCSKKLYESLLTGSSSSSEYDKIKHIKSRTIDYFAEDEN